MKETSKSPLENEVASNSDRKRRKAFLGADYLYPICRLNSRIWRGVKLGDGLFLLGETKVV